MAKLTLNDGTTIEATIEEFREMGAEFPGQESATAEQEFIEKPAQVGDKIRIVNRVSYEDRYENGDEFTVETKRHDGHVYVKGDDGGDLLVYSKEFEIIERPAKPALQVGDYAKVLAWTNGFAEAGDIVRIVEDDKTNIPYKLEHMDGSYAGYVYAKNVVKATDDEIAAATKPKFETGDYAYVVRSEDGNEGKIVEVIDKPFGYTDPEEGRIVVRQVVSGKVRQARPEDLRKATDEEVQKAQADAQFTALGRKPGEFKRGDIVSGISYGEQVTGSVENVGDNLLGARTFEKRYRAFEMAETKLIAPVEARVDQ